MFSIFFRIFFLFGAALLLSIKSLIPSTTKEENSSENIDFEIFGPTRINGVVGNGALSCGISEWGEITVLRYPSPSHWDQLDYKTKPGEKSRELKYFGALPNQGSFIAIYYNGKLIILRDIESNMINQQYKSEDSPILVTKYKIDDNTEVIVEDFVHPKEDILIREVSLNLQGSGDAYLINYSNFAPTTIKLPKLPLEDWDDDTKNDFAAFTQEGSVIQFTPFFRTRDELRKEYKYVRENINSREKLVEYAKNTSGIFIKSLAKGIGKSYSYIGFDERCGDGREAPLSTPESAFEKMKKFSPDNLYEIENENFVLCSADSVNIAKICEAGTCNKGFIIVALGKNLEDVNSKMNFALKNLQKLKSETEEYWSNLIGMVKEKSWFSKLKEKEKAVCQRALISILQATDRDTKATVASISTQPPYAEDWPRDGAYFNILLNLAGFTDVARERNYFYEKVQSKEPEGRIPAGTWRMNFYSDGMVGGPWDFEIDQVGFVIWSWATHLMFEPNKNEFLKNIYSALKLSVEEVLINCKDERNLQCLANEDDNPIPSVTIVGSAMVYAGLFHAQKIAQAYGDLDLSSRIKERMKELEIAMLQNYTDENGFITSSASEFLEQGLAYILFPANFPMKTEWIIKYGESLIDMLNLNFNKKGFLLYEGKWIISLIIASEILKNKDYFYSKKFKDEAEKYLRILIEEVPTKTYHYGEIARYTVKDGGKIYENRIAMPHVWEATLNCLTSIALRDPQTIELMGVDLNVYKEPRKEKKSICSSFGLLSFHFIIFLYLIWSFFRISLHFRG